MKQAASWTSRAEFGRSHETDTFNCRVRNGETIVTMSLTSRGYSRSRVSDLLQACMVMICLQASLQMPMDSSRATGLRKWMIGEPFDKIVKMNRPFLKHCKICVPYFFTKIIPSRRRRSLHPPRCANRVFHWIRFWPQSL